MRGRGRLAREVIVAVGVKGLLLALIYQLFFSAGPPRRDLTDTTATAVLGAPPPEQAR